MPRLINNVTDLKRHIILSATFDFEKVLPHAKRAERKIFSGLIGSEQSDEIIDHTFDADSDEPIDLVKDLFEEAVSHYALFMAMPTLNILITNAGTKTTDNTESSNADWKDKLDLNRSLVKIYTEALDEAFGIMEKNPEVFGAWKNSDYYTVFNELLVSQTKTFNDYFAIQNNRYTFFALKPFMREVESQYFIGMLGQCTLDFLKVKSTDAIINQAQALAQRAVVALTVSKVAENGAFSFTETSMTYSMDELPWEKKMQLSDIRLEKLQKARQTAGEEYLKQLKKIIVANPTVFDCYVDKIEPGLDAKIIRKKSGLTL